MAEGCEKYLAVVPDSSQFCGPIASESIPLVSLSLSFSLSLSLLCKCSEIEDHWDAKTVSRDYFFFIDPL